MTASYPYSVKDFVTYVDQPQEPSIIYAAITNEINDEVVSIEKTMGERPFLVPRTRSLGASIVWLYYNKSWLNHTHLHFTMAGLLHDDHPQYVRTDGTRGFDAPEASLGPEPWLPGHLIHLDQLPHHSPLQPNDYLTAYEMENVMRWFLALLGYQCTGEPSAPGYWGAAAGSRWKLTGGWTNGYTDYNGNIYVSFGNAFSYMVQSFVFMRMPVPGRSHYGYAYQYMEDQLIVKGISNQGAIIQFIEDNPVDRSAWVTMSWIAMGL